MDVAFIIKVFKDNFNKYNFLFQIDLTNEWWW